MKRPTFKVYCNIAFAIEGLAAAIIIAGWWKGLMDAPAMLQAISIAFGCTMIAYAGKSGFEHSQWATPIMEIAKSPITAAAVSGLMSGGDIGSALSAGISAAQMQEQTEQALQSQSSIPIGNSDEGSSINTNI